MIILKLENITKKYAGITALSSVNIAFKKGVVHSIIGENGAGKSTLINIITGAISQTFGNIIFRNEITKMTPILSKQKGIMPVYQELNLIDELKVYENIFYGNEISKNTFLDIAKMKTQSKEVLDTLGVKIDIEKKVKELGVGSKQIVEIAKVLISNPQIILFDEPTASLSTSEIEILHEIIKNLTEKGISVIFVSHKLDEVLKISDEISILRDGKLITHIQKEEKEEWNIPNLVKNMLGDTFKEKKEIPVNNLKKEVLKLQDVSNDYVKNINLELYSGEIFCIYGQLGSGRSELLDTIFGIRKIKSGKVFLSGEEKFIKNPISAIREDIGLITEDRKDKGLYLNLSIRENISISSLNLFTKLFFVDIRKEEKYIKDLLKKMDVKYKSLDQKVKELSGGNQQKVLIAKCLLLNPNIILL